jgi:hypothetical protein
MACEHGIEALQLRIPEIHSCTVHNKFVHKLPGRISVRREITHVFVIVNSTCTVGILGCSAGSDTTEFFGNGRAHKAWLKDAKEMIVRIERYRTLSTGRLLLFLLVMTNVKVQLCPLAFFAYGGTSSPAFQKYLAPG